MGLLRSFGDVDLKNPIANGDFRALEAVPSLAKIPWRFVISDKPPNEAPDEEEAAEDEVDEDEADEDESAEDE